MSCSPRDRFLRKRRPSDGRPVCSGRTSSGGVGTTPALEPSIKPTGNPFLQTVERRTLRPVAPVELQRHTAVFFEHAGSGPREGGTLHLLVGFEIPLEAPAIEIAGPDAHPVIANSHLSVQNARLELEDPHPVA